MPLDFYLWGTLKNTVYTKKPRILQDLRHEIESTCATIPLQTIQEVCHSVAHRQQCIYTGGGHFEYLRH